jgi:ubiquinone/menaquinone biosynthesis C-methylase UbiE
MITKEKLQEHISKFPDQISIDELIEKLIFIEMYHQK